MKIIQLGYEPNGCKGEDVVNEEFVVGSDGMFDEVNLMESMPAIHIEGRDIEKSQEETNASDLRSVVKEPKSDKNKCDELNSSKKNAKLNVQTNKSVIEIDNGDENLISPRIKRSERVKNHPV